MILGAIKNDPEPQKENTEIQEIKKELAELKKQVEWMKYGLIFIAIYYIYNQLTNKK
jgi:hypothetical protein